MGFGFEVVRHGMQGEASLAGELLVDMDTIAEKLNEHYRGFVQGDRDGLLLEEWRPRMDLQNLRHMHKHICSMDRGKAPQFPRFRTRTGMKEVPLSYALAHEDVPMVCMADTSVMEDPDGHHATAMIEATQIDDIGMVGWAEVFWRITKACPWISMGDLGRIFRVPVDWSGDIKGSPLHTLWAAAERHGAVMKLG